MKNSIPIIVLIFTLLFLSCQNTPQADKLFLCQCVENPNLQDSNTPTTKLKYIFLVEGKEGEIDCCNSPLAGKYPAFKETWINEAPEHPDVWGMQDGAQQEMSAEEAQTLACEMSNKEFGISAVDGSGIFVKQYYPKLADKK